MKERKYARVNVTEKELEQIDKIAENLGYPNRTELYTACIHILLYGEGNTLLLNHQRTKECSSEMQTFFAVIDDIAFPVIAMRGIAPVYTFLLDDIRRELYNRSQFVPSDETMKNWLKIYANIRRPQLLNYETEIRRQRYIEEETYT
ncbi:MAG: hypothetical protein IJD66_00920 [Methanocorpusculum sp.]|nr:hypothetical protein [Methanocorpusculum sp.]